jgi:hypothetical protein
VQDAFDAFIAERGINDSVAFFIPEYAAYKEQQVRFLKISLFYFASSDDVISAGVRQVVVQGQELHRPLSGSLWATSGLVEKYPCVTDAERGRDTTPSSTLRPVPYHYYY